MTIHQCDDLRHRTNCAGGSAPTNRGSVHGIVAGAVLLFVMLSCCLHANGIQISNVRLVDRNTDAGLNHPNNYCWIEFDIQWENSWRTTTAPGNWDAAWVFMKVKQEGLITRTIRVNALPGRSIDMDSVSGLYNEMPMRIISGAGEFPPFTVIEQVFQSTRSLTLNEAWTKGPAQGDVAEFRHFWRHVEPAPDGHDAGSGTPAEIRLGRVNTQDSWNATTNPYVGFFIQRSGVGSGRFLSTGVRIRWNYGRMGIRDDEMVSVRVFGIEMVYIPEGSFFVGDGSTTLVAGHLCQAGTTRPFRITSENEIGLGGTDSTRLGSRLTLDVADAFSASNLRTLPASFPKGYAAFYIMKHELNQEFYAQYLNTLTYEQQLYMTNNGIPASAPGTAAMAASNAFRNGIDVKVSGTQGHIPAVYACNLNDADNTFDSPLDGRHLACNYLSTRQMKYLLGWAGLRPLSELEFEKAARGPVPAVADERPWGAEAKHESRYSLSGFAGDTAVSITNPGPAGNTLHEATVPGTGPLRQGIFADSTSTKSVSGASYYGVLELAGNLNEVVASIGYSAGRFLGMWHGNGRYYSAISVVWGSTWQDDEGFGLRGGSWDQLVRRTRTSDRYYINSGNRLINPQRHGVRGGRRAE